MCRLSPSLTLLMLLCIAVTVVIAGGDEKRMPAEERISELLRKNVRVFCWIMSHPQYTTSRAFHVNATWAPHCNGYAFVSTDPKSGLPSIDVGIRDGRDYLWGKTKRSFEHLYTKELCKYDWFLKADDDTYVLMDNLRYMLLPHSPLKPLYFGCRFKPYAPHGYMSGGAGYVLSFSREAVRQFVEKGLRGGRCNEGDIGTEDVNMGACMSAVGATFGDSRDALGRHRMLPLSPSTHYDHGIPQWFYEYTYYPYEDATCCSDKMISFHYVFDSEFYAIEKGKYRDYGLGELGARNCTSRLKTIIGDRSRYQRWSDIKLLAKLKSLSRAESMRFDGE